MNKNELQRLQKIEQRIYQIAKEDLNLDFINIEFDIVPPNKMFELLAYGLPRQYSNWKFGREYEKIRTIYEKTGGHLPMELVLNTDPARAYLMKNNSFAIQALVMAHVVGHVSFFTMNNYFKDSEKDIISKLSSASDRFQLYEKRYGLSNVEMIQDAGYAIQFHSNPFDSEETEDEKRLRIFEKHKKILYDKKEKENSDMFPDFIKEEMEKLSRNRDFLTHQLWQKLKNKIPVEPTEDLLRFIIDNSKILGDWEKDILEIQRMQGRYYWPIIKTKYMNEGFATWIHENIMRQLFKEGLLNSEEHAQFNYSNSLVKAMNPFSLNPYMIGSAIWYDIEDRWNKGKYGDEYEREKNNHKKINWDTKEMNGRKKVMEVMKTHNDWFFMNAYLTTDIIRDIQMYIYQIVENTFEIKAVITGHTPDKVRDIIINSFAHSGIPKIEVVSVNNNELQLKHNHIGSDLEPEYTKKTLKHISNLWGGKVTLQTKVEDKHFIYSA